MALLEYSLYHVFPTEEALSSGIFGNGPSTDLEPSQIVVSCTLPELRFCD